MDFINELPETINSLQSNIDFYAIVFYLFAGITIVSGLVTILSKKLMRSAVGLLFTLFGVAGIFALLAADFIAVTQVMVYIGGILTLIVFGVMLTTRIIDVDAKLDSLGQLSVAIGTILAIAVGIFFIFIFVTAEWKQEPLTPAPQGTINSIGNLLMTDYLASFIAAAILLLVAFIGAALIARRKN
jgi:NADH-quinone oxidoreductase subunit J